MLSQHKSLRIGWEVLTIHRLRDTLRHGLGMGAIEAIANKLRTPKGHFTGSKIELIPEPEAHRAQTRFTLNLLVL